MLRIAAGKIFKDDYSALLAVQFEMVLEKMVNLRRTIMQRHPKENLLFQTLENKAVPMIWGIQQALDPRVFESVREMNGHVLWTIYWRLKCNPANKNMLFIDLLTELNKNPPFAMAFG